MRSCPHVHIGRDRLAALIVAAISGGGSVCAVVISKRALAWEQERDREGNEAKIEIAFGHAMVDLPGPKVINLNNITPEPMIYELTVNVLNDGARTEFIKSIWVEGAEPGGTGIDLSLDGDVELRPRARFAATVDAATIPNHDSGVVAIVHLASEVEVWSEVEQLSDRLMADIVAHNETVSD
jgi:hypothetical protein